MTWIAAGAPPFDYSKFIGSTAASRGGYIRTTRRPKLPSRPFRKTDPDDYMDEVVEASIQEAFLYNLNAFKAPPST